MSELFTFRKMLPSDRAYVATTWIEEAKKALEDLSLPALEQLQVPQVVHDRHPKVIQRYERVRQVMQQSKGWKDLHPRVVDKLLDSEHVTVTIAAPPDDDHTILGWIACSPTFVHFVYVTHKLRESGVATALLTLACKATPLPETVFSSHLWPYESRRYVFNPYLAAVDA